MDELIGQPLPPIRTRANCAVEVRFPSALQPLLKSVESAENLSGMTLLPGLLRGRKLQ